MKIIGIPSGDYDTATFDVLEEDYIKVTGEKPSVYDKSYFYVGLYRLYEVPFCKALERFEDSKTLIEIEYDDMGLKSITPTSIEAKYKYHGYENDSWFKGGINDDV